MRCGWQQAVAATGVAAGSASGLLTGPLRLIMFGQKKSPTPSHVIGASMHIAGDCHFQGELQLDGTVAGSVIADAGQPSSIRIGVAARVEGGVHADRIVVAGTVVGAVVATQRLELQASARIEGNVSYQAMDMQPGATVIGSFQPQLIAPVQAEPAASSADDTPLEDVPAEAQEPTEPTLDPQQPLDTELAAEQALLDPEQLVLERGPRPGT